MHRIGTYCLGIYLVGMSGAATAQTITQVMSGLDAPRGLAIGPEVGTGEVLRIQP